MSQIWQHDIVVMPADVKLVQEKLTEMEPTGAALASLVQIAIGGASYLDAEGRFVQGQPQPAFLLVFKRPKADEAVTKLVEA